MNIDPKDLDYADLLVAYTKLVNEYDELRIDLMVAVKEKNDFRARLVEMQKSFDSERYARIELIAQMEKLRRQIDGTLLADKQVEGE